jgi:hypothetical protein
MSKGWRLLSFGLFVGLALLMGATGAYAAPTAIAATPIGSATTSASAAATAPLATGHYGVQIGPDDQQGVLVIIVGVTLDMSVKLPARVRIPVPPGSSVAWAGEVLGNNPSGDKPRDYTLGRGEGGAQYAEFTLAESHQGQIDAIASPLTTSNGVVSATATFVQSVPGTSTAFAVRMPVGVTNVKIEPAPLSVPDFNDAGESLYPLGERSLAAGSKLAVTVSYSKVDTQTASGTTSPTLLPFLVIALVLVLVILAVVLAARRGPSGAESEEESDEDLDDESAEESDEGLDQSVDESDEDLDDDSAFEFDEEADGDSPFEFDEGPDTGEKKGPAK